MCGITGYVNYQKQPERKILSKMLKQIWYRGPDAEGKFIAENVVMGVQRLSIIDLKSGDQPISNEDSKITIVFNGEIYNYEELKSDLQKKGHIFKTTTDTEVLVHLYEEKKFSMPKYLNGMFAFAIWDTREQTLFLARDPIGIKPLYYYFDQSNFIFGSELKTILNHPDIKREINRNVMQDYLNFGYILGDESIFKGIFKLLPGRLLILNKKGLKIKKYWDLNLFYQDSNPNDLLKNAVNLQSFADVPIGVFLSGGIDSSMLAYYLTRKNRKKIKTFSITFDDPDFDESKYAKIVAGILKTEHYKEQFNSKDVRKIFPKLTSLMDEPLADPSLFPTYKLSQLAAKHVKVVLSGDGGDELYGGYPTYQGHILAEKIKRIPVKYFNLLTDLAYLSPISFGTYSKKDTLDKFFLGIKSDLPKRQMIWMSLGLNGKMRFTKSGWFKELKNEIRPIPGIASKAQFVDFLTYLRDDLLVKTDRASMFNSLEVRVPFLDLKLVSYAFSENRDNVDLFSTKKQLRKLASKIFPKEIVYRKKKGFGIPFKQWLKDDLYNFSSDLLRNKKLFNFISEDDIFRLWFDHQSGKANNSRQLWALIFLSGWLNNWI